MVKTAPNRLLKNRVFQQSAKWFYIILPVLAILLPAAGAFGATITMQPSRNPVTADETFELLFEASGVPDGEPDFTPLENDFELLSHSQSQSIRMINGDYSRSIVWRLSLMAKHTGRLTIPSIAFGRDHSPAGTVEVRKATASASAAANESLFVEVSSEPGSAYVRQQLVFHIRIYRAVNIAEASLSEPHFNDPDIIVEQLGKEQTFETQRQGRRYLVTQIDYLAFPQHSGKLILDPITFQARILQQNYPSFGLFGSGGKIKRVRSKAVQIEILAIPKDATRPWLPATNLQLSASWPKARPEFRVGEPVTRTLAIVADGITAAQLPQIHRAAPEGFKQYPDQPVLQDRKDASGVTGMRQEKIALVPTRPGRYTLPAIEIHWWNVQTGRQEVARIAEQQIQVLPAANAATSAPATPPATTPPIHETTPPPTAPAPPETGYGFHPWLALFFALGWLFTAIGWWRSHHRRPRRTTPAAQAQVQMQRCNKILARLKQACQRNDAAAARSALLDWGKSQWPDAPPAGLAELAGHFDEAAATALSALNRTLYGKEKGDWDGDAVWRAVKAYDPEKGRRKDTAGALARLYLSTD